MSGYHTIFLNCGRWAMIMTLPPLGHDDILVNTLALAYSSNDASQWPGTKHTLAAGLIRKKLSPRLAVGFR